VVPFYSALVGYFQSALDSNGRVVAQGAINAMKANAGRRELTSLQMSPGLLTA
jgi:hypothetical protein